MTDTEAAASAPAVMTQRTTVTLRLWRVKSQVKMMSTSWTPFGDESQGLKASARLDLLEIELDRARPNQPKTRAASKEKPEGHVRLEVEDSQGVSKYRWAIREHSKFQFGVSKYQPKIHNTNEKKRRPQNVQNTNGPFQNTNGPFQNTNGPFQNTNGPFQNTNRPFQNTN